MQARYFGGIQGLRAVAALLVVIQHAIYCAYVWRGDAYPHPPPVRFGAIGVTLFFAISGFVIALNRRRPVGRFAAHRLLRIYPRLLDRGRFDAVLAGLLTAAREDFHGCIFLVADAASGRSHHPVLDSCL